MPQRSFPLISDKNPVVCGGWEDHDRRRPQEYDVKTDTWAFTTSNAACGG